MPQIQQTRTASQPAVTAEERQRALAGDLATLADSLALALVLDGDRPFRAWLRGQAAVGDPQPLFVRLGRHGIWACLDGGRTQLQRDPPSGAQLDFFDRLQRDPAARRELEAAGRRLEARAQADRMIEGLLDRGADPTRSQMAGLLTWSPLLEHDAYRFGARCTSVLGDLRGQILPQPSAPAARPQVLAYWRLLLASGHLGLLASTRGARPWLVDMARSFTWVDWTPTMAFIQERSLWFAALAARHAVAFGADVVEPYLRVLALATHPLRVFDAAFGLTAIGLSEPQLAPLLAGELENQRRRFARQAGSYDAMHAAIVACAQHCLADPDAADHAFRKLAQPLDLRLAPRKGLLSRPAMRLDITASVEAVGYLGLLALPGLLQWKALDLYPERSAHLPVAALGPSDIVAHIARTWRSGSQPQARLH